jgi:alkylation response protein AidB-like acyl-CoA dehydrogenase
MTAYRAPVDDFRFLFHEFLPTEPDLQAPALGDTPREVADTVLAEAARFVEQVIAPLNRAGDVEGCRFRDGEVMTPAGFKEAYGAFVEAGWGGLTASPEDGGQGLPPAIGFAFSEMLTSANMAFAMYPGLTGGAYAAVRVHASEELRRNFLPRLAIGEWTGTMNLTEPQAGTDLALLRTRAEPSGDGTYRIHGTKIFISSGEHDLAPNIVHLVLARIPGAPEGTRGISLFIVPKHLVNADGTLGERNAVQCGSIEEKMGIHGNATCVMNYDGAVGYLVGDPPGEGGASAGGGGGGLRRMFTMMNAARIGVGLQGVALAEVAYQHAAAYARERQQGRSVTGPKAPDQPADPIIVHPDVRRMLMTARAFAQGGRALVAWLGLQADLARSHPDAARRRQAEALLNFLTPVVKAYLTDMGFESTNLALQCFGGYGYIREVGMEQFVRDARITQIYEGANGIQALDLVGRKLAAALGEELFTPIADFTALREADVEAQRLAVPLASALAAVREATAFIAERGLANADEAAAASADYLRAVGLLALGFMWARMAEVARERLAASASPREFYEAKLVTARFFMERMLPDVHSLLAKIRAGAESTMALEADAF